MGQGPQGRLHPRHRHPEQGLGQLGREERGLRQASSARPERRSQARRLLRQDPVRRRQPPGGRSRPQRRPEPGQVHQGVHPRSDRQVHRAVRRGRRRRVPGRDHQWLGRSGRPGGLVQGPDRLDPGRVREGLPHRRERRFQHEPGRLRPRLRRGHDVRAGRRQVPQRGPEHPDPSGPHARLPLQPMVGRRARCDEGQLQAGLREGGQPTHRAPVHHRRRPGRGSEPRRPVGARGQPLREPTVGAADPSDVGLDPGHDGAGAHDRGPEGPDRRAEEGWRRRCRTEEPPPRAGTE